MNLTIFSVRFHTAAHHVTIHTINRLANENRRTLAQKRCKVTN